MENLIPPIADKEDVTDVLFCDCCSTYHLRKEVFEHESGYKFCLYCAVGNRQGIVNGVIALHEDWNNNIDEINDFISDKINWI